MLGNHSAPSPGRVDLSVFTFLYILAVHLWQGSANLQVGWEAVAFLAIAASVFPGLFAWLRRPAGESSDKGESVWDIYPYWLQAALSVFGLLAILAPNSGWLPPAIEGLSFTWSWPMTGAFLVASPILLGLKKVVGGGPGYSWERQDHEEINRQAYEDPDLDDKGRIVLVVKDAVFYWKMQTRIPSDRAEEMGEELEQHLWDAVGEGKTVESVVGSDVEVFAESWAEEDLPPTSFADRAIEAIFAVSAFFTIAAGLSHLVGWTLYVQVIWFPVLLLLGASAWLVQEVVERVRRPQTGSLRKSWLLTAAMVLLVFGISAGLAFAIFGVKETVPLLESLR